MLNVEPDTAECGNDAWLTDVAGRVVRKIMV